MPNVLVSGVTLEFLDAAEAKGWALEERNKRANVEKSFGAAMSAMQALKNTDVTRFLFDPFDTNCLAEFAKALKTKQFDGIALGGGVRTIPELSDYFTEIVKLAREAQPTAVFVFPLLPSDVVPCLQKHVPGVS